jgi:hypothetical protein
MTKIIVAIALFISSLVSAQGQFEQAMGKAIRLFATFKPEASFSPKWGLERAQEALKNCK